MTPLESAICKFCEQEFFYAPVHYGKMILSRGRGVKGTKRRRNVCDLCRASDGRRARCKKYGPQAAAEPLSMAEQGEADYRHYVGSLKIIQPRPYLNDMHLTIGSAMGGYSADMECEHGRLPGDVCPSPRVVLTSPQFKGQVVQNWPHDHPCPCWGEENGRVA